MGGMLILLILVSSIGYSFQRGEKEEDNKINYNGFEFEEQNGFWGVNIEGMQFYFKYNPLQTDKINSEIKPINNYVQKSLYIYSENNEATLEIYQNFYQNQIVQRIQKACPQGNKCEEDIPMKTCEDNFIIIKKSDVSEVKQEENCVFIKGKSEELAKMTDSFLFKIIRIEQ